MRGKKVQMKKKSRKQRRTENGILFGSIILCIVTLTAVTFCMVLVFSYRASQLEAAKMRDEIAVLQENYTQEEVDAMLANEKENAALTASAETEEAISITFSRYSITSRNMRIFRRILYIRRKN